MATFEQALITAMQQGKVEILTSVNQGIMKASMGSKKIQPNLQVAVTEAAVHNYFSSKPRLAGFMLFVDGDELNKIANAIDERNKDS